MVLQKNNIKNEKWPRSLDVVEVALTQCNLVDDQYQQNSLLYNFMPKKPYVYLLNVEPSNLVFLNTEYDKIIITFTDQNGRPFKIKDKVNLTLLINK